MKHYRTAGLLSAVLLLGTAATFAGPAIAADGGFLTTHVLDTYSGLPAAGVTIDFFKKDGDSYKLVATTTTNADGRTDKPVMPKDVFATGSYQLVFHVAEYYKKLGVKLPDPNFLDNVPIQFSLADGKAHYHVPLLMTPWSYSTYRGS